MSVNNQEFLAALNRLSRDQIRQAGQRYTPGVDPGAPNFKIASLVTAIDNVACGLSALARFRSFVEKFSKAWDLAKHSSQRQDAIQAHIDEANAALNTMITRLRGRDVIAADEWVARLSAIEESLQDDIAHWSDEEAKLPTAQEEHGQSSERNTIRANLDSVRGCLAVVRDEKEFAGSKAFKTLFDPLLLVSGEWGTGKTHLLCDATQDRIRRGQATVLILSKELPGPYS